MNMISNFLLTSVLKKGQERADIVRNLLKERILKDKMVDENCKGVQIRRRVDFSDDHNTRQSSGSDVTTIPRPADDLLDLDDA
jgi:hypothetical protein